MIETSDPSDTARLDKSDARVDVFSSFCWHSDGKFHEDKKWAGYWGFDGMRLGGLCNCGSDSDLAPDPQEHTRSRAALKEIRPEGCGLIVRSNKNGTERAEVCVPQKDFLPTTDTLKTSEPAELHAAIQPRTRTLWRAGGIAIYTYGRMTI